MPGTHSGPPADAVTAYDELVASHGKVQRKGAAMPYTSVNGHMFSFLTQTGTLALRLPPDDRAAFVKRHKARLCEQHGTVLEEYVEVPAALLKKRELVKTYFDIGYNYVASLKPKPTAKRQPSAKRSPGGRAEKGQPR